LRLSAQPGGLVSAFVNLFAEDSANPVYAFSRSEVRDKLTNVHYGRIDFADEESLKEAAGQNSQDGSLDSVIVATGILHDPDLMPEKSLHELSAANFERSFFANTIGPGVSAPFGWRKKWVKVWNEVQYFSRRCSNNNTKETT
jgi:hypothetical protein